VACSSIRVPTLVLHRSEDQLPIEGARWVAERIPGARFVELPGGPHVSWGVLVAGIAVNIGSRVALRPHRVKYFSQTVKTLSPDQGSCSTSVGRPS
jgi:hypothetical protein